MSPLPPSTYFQPDQPPKWMAQLEAPYRGDLVRTIKILRTEDVDHVPRRTPDDRELRRIMNDVGYAAKLLGSSTVGSSPCGNYGEEAHHDV